MNKVTELFDKYNLEARFYPTFIAFIPIWLISYFIQDQVFITMGTLAKIFSSSLFVTTTTYVAVDIVRTLGKNLENKVFDYGKNFPTTNLLLRSNNIFSQNKRIDIFKKLN